jgi:hypothetical protein
MVNAEQELSERVEVAPTTLKERSSSLEDALT